MKTRKPKVVSSVVDLYRIYLPKRYEKFRKALKNEDHSVIFSILENIKKEITKEAKRT